MTTRRDSLKAGDACLGGAALHPCLSFGAEPTATTPLPLPTPAQIAWQDCEIVAVRLRIDKAKAEPDLRRLAVFNVT